MMSVKSLTRRDDRAGRESGGLGSPLALLQRDVNRLFSDFFGDSSGLSWLGDAARAGRFAPRLDIRESEREYRVDVELPGVSEEDVDISINRNVLSIRGEKKSETENKEGNLYHSERFYGVFERSMTLPDEVEADKVEARYAKGVLTIVLPKSVKAQARRIRVKAEGK